MLAQKNEAKSKGGLWKIIPNPSDRPELLLHHGEIVWRNGQRMCDVLSASYGHNLEGAVCALVMLEAEEPVNKASAESGDWQVETPQGKFPCIVSP